MTTTRQEFPPEFKREMAGLREGCGRSLMRVATEVGTGTMAIQGYQL